MAPLSNQAPGVSVVKSATKSETQFTFSDLNPFTP